MTQPSITDVVANQMRSRGLHRYETEARPVVEGLIEREETISSDLIDYAVGQGLRRDEAQQMLRDLGMHVRSAPVGTVASAAQANQETEVADADADSTLAQIQARLEELEAIAQAHGLMRR